MSFQRSQIQQRCDLGQKQTVLIYPESLFSSEEEREAAIPDIVTYIHKICVVFYPSNWFDESLVLYPFWSQISSHLVWYNGHNEALWRPKCSSTHSWNFWRLFRRFEVFWWFLGCHVILPATWTDRWDFWSHKSIVWNLGKECLCSCQWSHWCCKWRCRRSVW